MRVLFFPKGKPSDESVEPLTRTPYNGGKNAFVHWLGRPFAEAQVLHASLGSPHVESNFPIGSAPRLLVRARSVLKENG